MFRQRQSRRVGPELFERVVVAFFLMENVDDHIRKIRHDPLAQREAVDPRRADVVLFAQTIFQLAHERLQMRLRVSRADDEKIREAGQATHVERHDFVRFFIGEDFGAQVGELF